MEVLLWIKNGLEGHLMRNPNICRLVSWGIIVLGIVLFTVSLMVFGAEPLHWLSVLAGAVPFGGIVFSFFTVRCPSCGRLLPERALWTTYCPHCGEKIEG